MTEPTAFDLREQVRSGVVSAREVTETALKRIATDEALGAFIEVRPDLSLAEAEGVDRLLAAARRDERAALPPLLGLPTAHKDLVAVRGFTVTHGSAAIAHPISQGDDPIVAAVRTAGAICVGKTQVPEFGIAGYSENLIAPPARNPFDTSLTAGGSSGGTAVAIAAKMIPAAIGSDAGGSIRIPSAACGLVGLKPGRAVVPADALKGRFDEIGAPRMAVSGPMARTVRDAALFYDAITGEARDATGFRHESALAAVERAAQLRGLRIGVSFASPFESNMEIRYDDDARAATWRAAAALDELGHVIEETSFDYGDTYHDAFTTVWTQGLLRVRLTHGAEERLGALARWLLESARAASSDGIAAAVEALHQFAQSATRQWGRYDAVLTPALAFAPPAVGAFWADGPDADYRLQCQWAPQTSMVNVVGLPAIVVPAGLDSAGLPRGVQLIGRAGGEVGLLQLAAQLLGE
jgi:amidase